MGEATQKPGRFLLRLTLKLHQSPQVKTSPSIFVFTFDAPLPHCLGHHQFGWGFESLTAKELSPISRMLSYFFHDAITDKYQWRHCMHNESVTTKSLSLSGSQCSLKLTFWYLSSFNYIIDVGAYFNVCKGLGDIASCFNQPCLPFLNANKYLQGQCCLFFMTTAFILRLSLLIFSSGHLGCQNS